jgi:hypothetical protein
MRTEATKTSTVDAQKVAEDDRLLLHQSALLQNGGSLSLAQAGGSGLTGLSCSTAAREADELWFQAAIPLADSKLRAMEVVGP